MDLIMRLTCAVLVLGFSAFVRADDVSGFGRTVIDAQSDARKHALKILNDRLAEHDPPLTAWQPTLHDIDAMLDSNGHAGPSELVELIGLQHQWILPVRFPNEAEMVRRNRQALRARGVTWALIAASVTLAGIALWKRK